MQENKVIYFENNKPDGTGSFKAIPAYHTFSSWEGAACLHILISTRSIIPSDISINLYWCVILLFLP